jgi:hypothetical protein
MFVINGSMSNKHMSELGWEVVNWMHLVQSKDQWRAPVDMVTNVRFGSFGASTAVAFQEEFKHSGSINGGEFLDWLSNFELLKTGCAP